MTRDPMAPEALALGVLPEWMSEAVWRRLDRMGEPRNGDIAQALGLAVPPLPTKRNSPPAKRAMTKETVQLIAWTCLLLAWAVMWEMGL